MKRTDRPGPGMTLALVAGLILSSTPPAQATRLFVPDPPAGARPSAASATVVVDPAVARDLATKPRRIRLESLPLPGGDRASFEVAPIEVFAPGASVVEFDGRQFRPIPRPAVVVYAGSEVGSGGRDVVLSIVEGREVRMVARRDGQVLGAVEPASGPGTPSGTHAVVDPGEMPPREATPCAGDVAPPGGRAGIGRSAAPPAGARFAVQVGAFSQSSEAERLEADLRKKGLPVYVQPATGAAESRWRVRVGPWPSRAEADAVAARLKSQDKLPVWILEESGT